MGTYYNSKITVHGNEKEKAEIEKLLLDDLYVNSCVNKWSGELKNYYPSEHLERISKECKETYILLRSVGDQTSPYTETIFYRGVAMNGLHKDVFRESPISAVKKQAGRLRGHCS